MHAASSAGASMLFSIDSLKKDTLVYRKATKIDERALGDSLMKRDKIAQKITKNKRDRKGLIEVDSAIAFSADTNLSPDSNSIVKLKKHSPKRAVLLSALLPGLGQAYNHKYWKIPIVYAGFGGLGYALYYYGSQYQVAHSAYRNVVNGRDATYLGVSYKAYDNAATIKAYSDFYKSNLTTFALVTVLWYALNLVDAAVDGHLYSYNMDDKLSMHIDPSFHLSPSSIASPSNVGLTFTFQPLMGRKSSLNSR